MTKAFDSVSHMSIVRALKRFQVPEHLISYIMSTYNAETLLKSGSYTSEAIRIRRGVRQGDPLSPLLFNLVIDELLCASVNLPFCNAGNATILPIMAFADDLVCLGDTRANCELVLGCIVRFLCSRGLRINSRKCHAISVSSLGGRLCPNRSSIFHVDNNPIPSVSGINSFSYLGHEFSHSGVLRPNIANLPIWLENLQKAPLKPDQKMSLLRFNLIPRLLYGLQNTKLSLNILKHADLLIRAFVKRCLHLHIHTQDTLIHSRYRDGGLGVLSLVDVIPRTFSKRLENLANSHDAVIRDMLSSQKMRDLRDKYKRLSSIPRPGTFIPDQVFSAGLEQCGQDTSSNSWIPIAPHGWSGRDYVRAIHLRTANLPTVGIPSNPPEARRCREGCSCDETICHVLQACPRTKDARIARHNLIVKKIKDHCVMKRRTVEVEPHVRLIDGSLDKPDLAIHIPDNKTVICDVQISWDSNNLRQAWIEKRNRYGNQEFVDGARKKWPGREMIFAPLILGARGIWPSCNRSTESLLDIPHVVKRSCVNAVLKFGCSIHNIFMRSVRDHRPAGRRTVVP